MASLMRGCLCTNRLVFFFDVPGDGWGQNAPPLSTSPHPWPTIGVARLASEMRPQSCKSKGRRLQQRVAADILRAFPHLAPDDCVSTSMGAPGEDVRLSAAARACVGLSIECKNVEKINVWACLEQCQRNAPPGTTPCLVFSRNRSPTYAVVPWGHLLSLCRRSHRAGGTALASRARALVHELSALLEAAADDADEGDRGGDEGECGCEEVDGNPHDPHQQRV